MNTPAQPDVQPRTPPAPATSRPQYLRDSMHTHIVLLRFCTLSLATAILDNVAFYIVFYATGTILGSQVVARIASVWFNYRFVRSTVFCSDKGHHTLLPRYLVLAAANLLLSYAGIKLLRSNTHLSVLACKIVAETILFVLNFAVQRAFIFKHRPKPVN